MWRPLPLINMQRLITWLLPYSTYQKNNLVLISVNVLGSSGKAFNVEGLYLSTVMLEFLALHQ